MGSLTLPLGVAAGHMSTLMGGWCASCAVWAESSRDSCVGLMFLCQCLGSWLHLSTAASDHISATGIAIRGWVGFLRNVFALHPQHYPHEGTNPIPIPIPMCVYLHLICFVRRGLHVVPLFQSIS